VYMCHTAVIDATKVRSKKLNNLKKEDEFAATVAKVLVHLYASAIVNEPTAC
jgi:hypothetical protein